MIVSDLSRAWRTDVTLAVIWILVLAARITFGVEYLVAMSCLAIILDVALCLAPFLRVLVLLILHRFRMALALSVTAVLVIFVAVCNVHKWQAQCFVWRKEALLLQQVDLLRNPANAHPVSPLVYPVRVDRIPFRVYWPYMDWGLGSAGLVWDPETSVARDSYAFSEHLVIILHLSGPWYYCGFT